MAEPSARVDHRHGALAKGRSGEINRRAHGGLGHFASHFNRGFRHGTGGLDRARGHRCAAQPHNQ